MKIQIPVTIGKTMFLKLVLTLILPGPMDTFILCYFWLLYFPSKKSLWAGRFGDINSLNPFQKNCVCGVFIVERKK
jgi:hypothetical protein